MSASPSLMGAKRKCSSPLRTALLTLLRHRSPNEIGWISAPTEPERAESARKPVGFGSVDRLSLMPISGGRHLPVWLPARRRPMLPEPTMWMRRLLVGCNSPARNASGLGQAHLVGYHPIARSRGGHLMQRTTAILGSAIFFIIAACVAVISDCPHFVVG